MAGVSCSPWMGTVTSSSSANTPQSLYSLLTGLAANLQPTINGQAPNPTLLCANIQIQADPGGGSAKYYIGTSAMSSANVGQQLAAAGAGGLPGIWNPGAVDFNLYDLRSIYLMSDTGSVKWNVMFVRK